MTKRLALVTGGSGWLGSQLLRKLAEEGSEAGGGARPIRCLAMAGADHSELARDLPTLRLIQGDLADPNSLVEFLNDAEGATLFHCAGIVHPTRGVKEFHEVNARGTAALVAMAAENGIKRFIHVSSNSPIGVNAARDELFDESSPYRPYMNYGLSKKLAEDAVNEAGDSGKIETAIIRPPWFYGPGQPPRQSLFFTMIKNGTVPIVGSGENRRSMAYVDNICQGLLLCESVEEAAGRTYWIADERPYSMNEIVDTIESVMEDEFGMKVAHKRRRLPGVASEVAWLFDKTLQGMGLYHQKIHVLSEMNKTIACSIDKARAELGYDPEISLREGMIRSLRWILDRGITI